MDDADLLRRLFRLGPGDYLGARCLAGLLAGAREAREAGRVNQAEFSALARAILSLADPAVMARYRRM